MPILAQDGFDEMMQKFYDVAYEDKAMYTTPFMWKAAPLLEIASVELLRQLHAAAAATNTKHRLLRRPPEEQGRQGRPETFTRGREGGGQGREDLRGAAEEAAREQGAAHGAVARPGHARRHARCGRGCYKEAGATTSYNTARRAHKGSGEAADPKQPTVGS